MDTKRLNKLAQEVWVSPHTFCYWVPLIALLMFFNNRTEAVCTNLIKGTVVVDLIEMDNEKPACQDIKTTQDILKNIDSGASDDMKSDAALKPFLKAHQGALINVKVLSSEAQAANFKMKGGALKGQKIKMFVPASTGLTCTKLRNARIKNTFEEKCCDNITSKPCLLDTPYLIQSAKILGSAKTAAGDKKRKKTRDTDEYRKAVNALKAKNFDQAIKSFKAADQLAPLDTSGVYLLAFSYFLNDDCRRAIPILRKNLRTEQKADIWADQQKLLDRSNFLLARCYAHQGEIDESLIILESFLLSPSRYKDKIKDSLNLPEFRSLHVSKRWTKYKAQTATALK